MSDPFDLTDDAGLAPAPTGRAPIAAPARYLDGLNQPQHDAVTATEGPVLVLAGAGTGKTRVLTTRLAHILATRRAWPSQILAVTFTNKAAREMQERIGRIIGASVEGMPWLGTFHAVAARLLRRHAELVGLKSNFTILDTDDQIRLLKQLILAANIDEKRWPARYLAGLIDQWKNRGLGPAQVPEADGALFADGHGKALYQAYQARLKILNACDFGDLLLHNIHIFQQHGDVLRQYQERLRYILVDEYQDTNIAQYLWLRLLALGHANICCVGDDDQSIYGWRGAEVGNILRFEKDFPGAKVIRLEQNYRSTQHILGAASGLIAHNQGRLGKTLWSDGDTGAKVTVAGVWDNEAEARLVTQRIEALRQDGQAYAQVAILVRASSQMRSFEDRFLTTGLPYRVVGGPRFYERREIRDAMAYLRVIAQPDDDLALERIINVPKRGLGDASLQKIHALARRQGYSMNAAARSLIDTDELPARARTTLRHLLGDFDRWRGMIGTVEHRALAEIVLEESGYTQMWMMDKSPDAQGRLENLTELVRGLAEFDSLASFLEHVSLVMDNDAQAGGDKVSLMTLHAAKGLEFDHVFLPGWEEGVFPNQRALDEGGNTALEEERRLAYVGLTRARRQATIVFAANRLLYGKWQSALPSRFIDELPAAHVMVDADQGLYGHSPSQSEWIEAPAPIFGRRQTAAGQAIIEAKAEARRERAAQSSAFGVGERVFHEKFGYGEVRAVEGAKLLIHFETSGDKRVLDSFVRAA
ncbi:MAG: UvrD-helicase domain-containing protein [Sphingomonadales bacterium]